MSTMNLRVYVDAIVAAPAFDELNGALTRTRKALGFDHYLFMQFNNSGTDTGILLQDYPASWVAIQSETLGFLRSPIIKVASRQPTPFMWTKIGDLVDLSVEQRDYLAVMKAHGMADGYTIPIHVPGGPSAFFSFVTAAGRKIDEASIPPAMYIASECYIAANRIRRLSPAAEQTLSEQDVRIVTLLCRGQGKALISQKLGIEKSEVSAAISRACRHYRAGTQTEMIVHALWHQSIRFQDVIG